MPSLPPLSALLAIASCVLAWRPASADSEDPPQPPRTASVAPRSTAMQHMRAKFDSLRAIEHALLRGEFVAAKVSARELATAADEPELAVWSAASAHVRALASEVATATSTEQALRKLPAVAAACAECHVATGSWPPLAAAPPSPRDDGKTILRMAKHQWATDRMWSGLVGGSEAAWRAGLEVLVATPPPFAITDADEVALGHQLQSYAATALRAQASESLDARVHAYGEMLVICAACHETKRHLTP